MQGKLSFTTFALCKETSKQKTNSKRSDNLLWLHQYVRQCLQQAVTQPRSLGYKSLLCLWTLVPKDMNLLHRNAVRARATCDDTKPPCFASVMPESPQTMISLVANYAAGITTLPRKTGLHYCRAATQNILWCQEMPATELFFWTVSLGSNLSALDKLYIVNQIYSDLSSSHQNSAFLSHKMDLRNLSHIGLRQAYS